MATRGEWRCRSPDPWIDQPAVSVRGLFAERSEGRDPPAGALDYVSVVLEPWAAPLYLGAPAAAFAHAITDLSLVAPALTAALARTAEARTPAERLAHVASSLERRLWGAASDHRARERMREDRAMLAWLARGHPVAAAAARLTVSPRRLHQRCVDRLGVGHKTFAQVARFARGVEALHPGAPALHAAAWRGEHADQSHATRTFRDLAGVTPGTYTRLKRLAPRTRFCLPAEPRSGASSAA